MKKTLNTNINFLSTMKYQKPKESPSPSLIPYEISYLTSISLSPWSNTEKLSRSGQLSRSRSTNRDSLCSIWRRLREVINFSLLMIQGQILEKVLNLEQILKNPQLISQLLSWSKLEDTHLISERMWLNELKSLNKSFKLSAKENPNFPHRPPTQESIK